jgi:predicted DNA-binding transcriptional regulator AlpA
MFHRSKLLTEKEVAALLGVSASWLQKRRVNLLPPAYVKIGAMVRYEPSAIEAFIAAGGATAIRPVGER